MNKAQKENVQSDNSDDYYDYYDYYDYDYVKVIRKKDPCQRSKYMI